MHIARSMVMAVTLGMVAAGCASPGKIREDAAAHEARARYCHAHGDYKCAEQEREAARKEYRKAADREAGYM